MGFVGRDLDEVTRIMHEGTWTTGEKLFRLHRGRPMFVGAQLTGFGGDWITKRSCQEKQNKTRKAQRRQSQRSPRTYHANFHCHFGSSACTGGSRLKMPLAAGSPEELTHIKKEEEQGGAEPLFVAQAFSFC